MNILTTNRKGGLYENIDQYMKRALVSNECELEWIFGSHPRNTLSKDEFLRILNYLRKNNKLVRESNSLDIRLQHVTLKKTGLSNIRCSIDGITNIKKYCKTNSIIDIPTISFIKKQVFKDIKNPSLKFNSLVNTDYNFRINLKEEIILDENDEEVIKMKDNLKDGLKYYRYKKRFSFITEDNLFRIDLSAVKSNLWNRKRKSYNLFKNLISSNILNGKEIYELEIEYIGYNKIDDIYPIEIFHKKVVSDREKEEEMSKIDYEKQLAITTYNDNITSFSPEGTNIHVNIDNLGWGFPIQWSPETIDQEIITEESKPKLNTAWTRASSLRGNPMDLIWMNYWHDRGGWLFWGIIENEKKILFDGVRENFTDTYTNAPKNENYIKYIIQPEFTEEEINALKEKGEKDAKISGNESTFYKKYEDSFDNKFNVPFKYIYGLDDKESSELKGGGNKDLPSWAPKNSLSKDKIFVETINLKLNEIITKLLIIINESNLIISQRKKNEILQEYKTLTEQNTDKINFIGPGPVSMSLNELNLDNPFNILSGYVVTEKADGIRAQLFIDKKRDGYLITQRLNIIHTGLNFHGSGSVLLDGEYITKNKDDKEIKLFMIFDIYYLDSGQYPNHPYTLPWIGKNKSDICRSKILHDFKTKAKLSSSQIISLKDGIFVKNWKPDLSGANNPFNIDTKDTIRIGYKNYFEGPKILKKNKKDSSKYTNIKGIGKISKKILERGGIINDKIINFEYKIDGLIYLPMFLSVGSNNEEFVKNIGSTWYQNYKWKPPEENTIDFRIKFIKENLKNKTVNKITSFTKNKKTIKCQQVHLYVGYDIKKDNITDFTWKVMGYEKKRTNEILFNPPTENNSIHICNIPMNKDKLICLKDKTEVIDGIIYEMKYIPDNPFGYQWIPLRAREDKYRPNNSHTANNVWSTIQNPVTEDLITGKGDIYNIDHITEEKEINEYSYYVSEYSEDINTDIPIREFHNYIKSKLINSITSLGSKSISILDTSIGQGGDINKYFRSENPIEFILCLDLSPDINKAAKRYYLQYTENIKKPKAMFIQYDTGSSIKDGEGCVGDHTERNKLLIDILYDRQKKLPQNLRSLVPKYKGLGNKGFNLISSQFTLHYYFKDELTLRNYIKNISDNIKKEGYFIGTCYDGMKVFKKLENETNNFEMIDDFGNKVFSITKKYSLENFNYLKDNKEELFGQEIDVYMNSIGKTFTEYLVNFEMFIDIMKEYDLYLIKPKFKINHQGIFDEFQYIDGLGGFEQIINELNKLYSKDLDLKQYFPESFNLLKKENKLLKELSSLNNWFIFQKQ